MSFRNSSPAFGANNKATAAPIPSPTANGRIVAGIRFLFIANLLSLFKNSLHTGWQTNRPGAGELLRR
jgi:hypothetical protein